MSDVMHARYFKIPDEVAEMINLINAIPDEWSGKGCVDGSLEAPNELLASGKALWDTGILLSRFHDVQLRPRHTPRGDQIKPDLFAIFAEQKLPGFISFSEAGYGNAIITLPLAKRFATHFLQLGYRGGLRFYSGCPDDDKYDNPERVDLELKPWQGAPFRRPESGYQPPRVKLEWKEGIGSVEHLAAIFAVCEKGGFEEYQPVESAAA